MDNINAVLEHRDRVRGIDIEDFQNSIVEMVLPAMQQPFPELTFLLLWAKYRAVSIVPDSLLGGSAPRLEVLALSGIPFPGLPKLLLSATHLVDLSLFQIPHSGYISPDTMVTILSPLSSLKSLTLGFESPRSCPDLASRPLSPSTRSVLSVLTIFEFKGVSEYLEDFVDLIDTPQLNKLDITFFNDVVFETPQFIQFITRTPMLRALEKAFINIWDQVADVIFLPRTSEHRDLELKVGVSCRGLDWQISSVVQFCTSCLPPLSMMEDLYIFCRLQYSRRSEIENGLWVELLHPFTVVKNLHLCRTFAPRIGPALQELVDGKTIDVLPALENIFLQGLKPERSVEEGIGEFVAARQVAGHPITVSPWANWKKDMIPLYYRP